MDYRNIRWAKLINASHFCRIKCSCLSLLRLKGVTLRRLNKRNNTLILIMMHYKIKVKYGLNQTARSSWRRESSAFKAIKETGS